MAPQVIYFIKADVNIKLIWSQIYPIDFKYVTNNKVKVIYQAYIAKLSQVPAKLDWDSFIITIPIVRVRPSPAIVSKKDF